MAIILDCTMEYNGTYFVLLDTIGTTIAGGLLRSSFDPFDYHFRFLWLFLSLDALLSSLSVSSSGFAVFGNTSFLFHFHPDSVIIKVWGGIILYLS